MELIPVKIDERCNSHHLIAQSNQLTEARYSLSVVEQRLVLTLLSYISPDDEDLKTYEIPLSNFKQLLNIDREEKEQDIRKILVSMASYVIQIPTDEGFLISHWFSSALLKKDTVSIALDFRLKPYLLQLKEKFTKLNLFTVTQFRSSYTIRIYMLLKQYEKIGYREFDLDEFKEILGIKDTFYPDFKRLRARVINQAKKDFEKKENGFFVSDITFDLETIRTGRKITRLRFNIRKQTYQQHLDLAPPDDSDNEDLRDVIAVLEDYGISEKMAQNWLEKYGQKYVEEKLYLVREQKPDKPSGYLRKAVEENYTSSSTITRQQEQAKQLERIERLKAEFHSKWLEMAKHRYYQEAIAEAEKVLGNEFLQELREQAEQKNANSMLSGTFKEKAIEGAYRALIKENVLLPTEEKLVELKASTPAPTLDMWQGELHKQELLAKHIKAFSAI